VVRPALGASLAALLSIAPAACTKPSDTPQPKPDPTTAPPEKVGMVPAATDAAPFVSAPPEVDAGAPEIPDPGLMPPVGKTVPKPGVVPKPGKTTFPTPGPKPKDDPFPKVGLKMDPDRALDDEMPRPTRARRRATDPTYQAMIGSGPRRLG
jgi:hypothetical protein